MDFEKKSVTRFSPFLVAGVVFLYPEVQKNVTNYKNL